MNSKLRLFHAIDPGEKFWLNELNSYGPDLLIERIEGDAYEDGKRSVARIKKRLIERNLESLYDELARAGAQFLTSESSNWPHPLNDLVTPPIGLVFKGSLPKCNAVAIVGTRNPTQYGARIASEFASGFSDRALDVISGGAYGIGHRTGVSQRKIERTR